jgi:hypothetical protein
VSVTRNMYYMADTLIDAVHNEVMKEDGSYSTSDARFVKQLAESASFRHLLLISVAAACHRLHQELHGVSPV